MDINTLNDKQKEAVLHIGGPMLVFAGAGSGKTMVLTYKIAYLIEEVGMDPENILAVTFTNKAAQEMKVRIHELVDGNIKGLTIGTFHSIGAMLLRKEIHKIGWNNDFTIYDTTDAKALIKKVIKDMNLDVKMYDPRSIYANISSYKNNLQSPEDVRKIALNTKDQNIAEIYSAYQSSLKDNKKAL